MSDLGPTSTALDLAAALRARELSSVELVDACLAAVDERNGEVNAVIWRNDDEARAAASEADRRIAAGDTDGAPFLGVPLPIKDLNLVAGQPATFGSTGASDAPAEVSDLSVEGFLRAGFVLCGRTNTPEFGPITVTENTRYGITRNPWDLDRSPGGSSGGAGAAVAAGMFPVAHATDGGGSIRIPASYCGLVGLKPSRGRVPDLAQGWLGSAVENCVSTTVADTAAVLDTISGPDPHGWYSAPAPERPFAEEAGREVGTLRVGVMASAPLGIPTDPALVKAVHDTAALLEELGHEISEVEVPTMSEELVPSFVVLTQAGLAAFDGVDWAKVEPHNQHSYEQMSTQASAVDYVRAAKTLEIMTRPIIARWRSEFDVLLTPTSAILPPVAGEILAAQHAAPDQPNLAVVASVAFTAFGNVSGLPAISLPLFATEDGLPAGVMLTGAPFDEAGLIRLSAQLEQARPWARHAPMASAAAA